MKRAKAKAPISAHDMPILSRLRKPNCFRSLNIARSSFGAFRIRLSTRTALNSPSPRDYWQAGTTQIQTQAVPNPVVGFTDLSGRPGTARALVRLRNDVKNRLVRGGYHQTVLSVPVVYAAACR